MGDLLIEPNQYFVVYDLASDLSDRNQPIHRRALGHLLHRAGEAVELIVKHGTRELTQAEEAAERAAIAQVVSPADGLAVATEAALRALADLRAALEEVSDG